MEGFTYIEFTFGFNLFEGELKPFPPIDIWVQTLQDF